MKGVRHIVMAKAWATVLVFVAGIALFDDVRHALTPERWDSWSFPQGMRYKQAGLEIENTVPEKGIWLSSRMMREQERGTPNWWVAGLVALSLIQVMRHLEKARREVLAMVRERK